MTTERQRREKTGRRAENLAAVYLTLKGYKIVARRFKTKSGEIDLIARRKSLLIVVEVKARKSMRQAEESISQKSKKRIETAAFQFMSQNRWTRGLGLRFDVIFVLSPIRLKHMKDYWRTR